MATVSIDGTDWTCTIIQKGYPKLHRTFSTEAEATSWGTWIEEYISREEPLPDLSRDHSAGRSFDAPWTINKVIDRYLNVHSPLKVSGKHDQQPCRPHQGGLRHTCRC